MNDILNPYIERGEKNKLLLAPEIIPIFDYIKQDKDKGLSLPTIKNNLLNSDFKLKKDRKTICQTTCLTGKPNDKDNNSILQVNNQDSEQANNNNQVIALLEKQIEDLKAQIEKQADDFKNQLNQKDQQIHQLHVLLKESKTSTIDYKPDENLGVFSKVLVKFG
ncbi:MAG: hypothetical protein GY730_02350, partial [bacterium]|nr:hypothetical protein [bacterium]